MTIDWRAASNACQALRGKLEPDRMRNAPERAVFTVVRHPGGWAVEYLGEITDASPDKEVAKAAANRKARVAQDAGQPCLVRVFGEHGFFNAA